jgi:D-glycero-D-manno-heptose 1,7-bisphosphate phosphatase
MCRKPATTFIKKAEKDYKLNLKDSYVIGDKDSDIEMGKKAGCKVINAKKANAEEMLALVKAGKSLE